MNGNVFRDVVQVVAMVGMAGMCVLVGWTTMQTHPQGPPRSRREARARAQAGLPRDARDEAGGRLRTMFRLAIAELIIVGLFLLAAEGVLPYPGLWAVASFGVMVAFVVAVALDLIASFRGASRK